MGWAEDKDTLLAGGYSEPEVQSIAGGIADHMSSNGYSPEDMADYFGRPKEPPTGKLTEYFNQQFKAHLPNEDAVKEAGHTETRIGAVTQAVKKGIVSGYQNSVVGLRARGALPDTAVDGDSLFDDTGDKITNAIGHFAEGVSGLVSDTPTYLAGGMAGAESGAATGAGIGGMFGPGGAAIGGGIGALVGSGGGAFATQRALRAALMQAYSTGGVHSFSQFADVAKTTAVEAAKGFAIGSAMSIGGVGGKALSSVMGIGGRAAAAIPMAGEFAAMTGAGAAVDGKMPEPMDLVNNALLMVGLHNVPGMKAAQEKLSNIFTDTAAHPHDVAADALVDPVLKQQILSSDPHTPAALSHLIQPDVRSSQVVEGGKLIPAQEAAQNGHFDFTGTPSEFAKKTEAMFHPNERAKVARAHDPVAFKTVADLASEVKNIQSKIQNNEEFKKDLNPVTPGEPLPGSMGEGEDTVYHGTNSDFNNLDYKRGGGMVHFAEKRGDAVRYSQDIGSGGRNVLKRDQIVIHTYDDKSPNNEGKYTWNANKSMWENERGTFLQNSDVQKLQEQGEASAVSKNGRVIEQKINKGKILDTRSEEGLKTVADILSKNSNKRAREFANSALADIDNKKSGSEFGNKFWGLTKLARGDEINAGLREVVKALQDKGYEGIRFLDDSHHTIAHFEPKERPAEESIKNDIDSENKAHQTRLNEIKENGDAVKSRIADAYSKAHDTLTENLKDHVRNANLNLGDLPESKVLPDYNPDFTNQEDHNLFLDNHAKDAIIAKDDELRQLMGRHAGYEPEDGVRDTLAKHPELAKLIAPEMVKESTSETGQKTLRILPKPKKSVEKASWEGFKKYVYDDLNGVKLMTEDAREKLGDIPLSAQPDVLALHSRASLNRAKVFIGDVKETGKGESTFGPYDPRTGKQTNESLYSALNSTPDHDIDGLREYMLYNQIIDENKAGRSTGVNDLEAREFVEKNRGRFEETAKRVTAWANAVNDYAEASGLLASDVNDKFKKEHPNYVPANRVNEETGRAGGVKTGTNLFKTREGSELPYLDPINSLVQKAENIARAVEENNAKLAAVEQNRLLVEAGHDSILEPVEIKGGLDESGNETLQFDKSKDERTKLADNQMGYYENGEYKVVAFKDPEIAKILKFANGDTGTYKLLTKFAAPANLVAKATRFAVSTGTNFVVNHMIRSETFTATVSEQNRLPFIGTMSFLSDAFGKNSPEFVEALKSGALDGIMSDVNRDILNDRKYTLGDDHGTLSTVHNGIKTIAGAGHALINLEETAKRMSVFSDLKEANPNATWDDILQAGKSARRSSVDGLQRGAGMQFLNSVIPFMHYEIQGLGRNLEAWKENPNAMAARTAMMLGLTALNWYANKDSEKIKNLNGFEKNAFWNFEIGDHVYRIAKDWGEGKVACTLLERTLDYFENHNPRAMDGFADTLKNIVPIPFINRSTALGEAKDVLVNNYNSLTGRQYIPQHLMDLAPESRAMPYTSELAKATAGVLGHLNGLGMNLDSPMMVDYAIKQFTGDNGVALVRATETALEKVRVIAPTSKPAYEAADIPFIGALIARDPTYNAQPLKDFQNEYSRLKQNYNTYQGYLKAGNMDAAQKFLDKNPDVYNFTLAKSAHKAIGMATKQIQNYNVMPNDRMSPSDKKQTSEDLWKTSINIATQTLNQLDNMRENSR